jgi:hypothetical protein
MSKLDRRTKLRRIVPGVDNPATPSLAFLFYIYSSGVVQNGTAGIDSTACMASACELDQFQDTPRAVGHLVSPRPFALRSDVGLTI